MSRLTISAAMASLLAATGTSIAQDSGDVLKSGANAYRICAACHSLVSGVHLSGPSLAGVWGRAVASAKGFGRYTKALESQDFVWDENTLNAWLADPQAMVPGTTMLFRGIESDDARVSLIAFLRVAMEADGYERVVKDGLIPEDMARGQIPPDLAGADEKQRITAMRHCGDAFHLTTADGAQFPLWETNVRLKIDTSERGPEDEAPVLLRSGMAGDRVSVVFSSLENLNEHVLEECKK